MRFTGGGRYFPLIEWETAHHGVGAVIRSLALESNMVYSVESGFRLQILRKCVNITTSLPTTSAHDLLPKPG